MVKSHTEDRAVLLVLHDVSAESWPDYQGFVEAVDTLGGRTGAIPINWLVVPDFHRRNPLESNQGWRRLLDHRVARGDELILHGYFHEDQGPPPRTPHQYFMRRIYTWEGEFYAMSEDQARARLEAGIELFDQYDWPLNGFVAPAWLMSQGTRRALRDLPLRYSSDAQHLLRLPDLTPINAPGLVWSAGSAWRRGLSKVLSDRREARWQAAPVIRLGLHPVDMRHDFSRRYWLNTLERLLEQGRQPRTKIDWLDGQPVATHAR